MDDGRKMVNEEWILDGWMVHNVQIFIFGF
jgi:hypothetical protein